MKKILSVIVMFMFASVQSFAQENTPNDPLVSFPFYSVEYFINSDGTHTETHTTKLKVLQEAALEGVKRTGISYSTSVQKAEVLEGYTLKKDGTEIKIPKDNYQSTVSGGQGGNPAFSDMTTLSAVFPDAAVGDTLVFSYKLTQSEAIFPGQFSVFNFFPKSQEFDDVQITINAPKDLWMQHEVRLMEESPSSKGGREITVLRYSNKNPVDDKRTNFSLYNSEEEPGFSFSTFKSYQEIAEAYGARARPKARVTDRIQKLAESLAPQTANQEEVARALYDWVTLNITYAGNCIGVGSVVPRDLGFVLDNKMGDCKDHATLLQALLTARHIPSSQALVKAGGYKTLPKIPVVEAVNHVINYLPEQNRYVDSTSQSMPFGLMSVDMLLMPALLVDGYKEGSKIPDVVQAKEYQEVKTEVDVHPDGSAQVKMSTSYRGLWAANARARLRKITNEQKSKLVSNLLRTYRMEGDGTIDIGDPAPLQDSYSQKINFNLKNFIQADSAGAFYIMPLLPTEFPIWSFLRTEKEDPKVDILCSGGKSIERYTYRFPKNRKLISVPKDFSKSNGAQSFKVTYKYNRAKNILDVAAEFDDPTVGTVCSPEVSAKYSEFAKAVGARFREQVLYK